VLALHTRCDVTLNGPERKRARLSRGRAQGKTDYPAGRWDEIKGGREEELGMSFILACLRVYRIMSPPLLVVDPFFLGPESVP
jgi:hypothetical protein